MSVTYRPGVHPGPVRFDEHAANPGDRPGLALYALQFHPQAFQFGKRLVATHCAFCGVQCGMHLRVADDRVIGVEPRMDTHNEGKLCPKGVGAYQQISHPDRLTHPLVRDADGLRRATWDAGLRTTIWKSWDESITCSSREVKM